MRVIANCSFVGKAGDHTISIAEGDIFDLPDGTDWLQAKFVTPVIEPVVIETAAIGPTETAAKPKARRAS